MFVPWSFQLRLGLLCLLLVLVLVGRRGCGQRGVCVACKWILLEDMWSPPLSCFGIRFFGCIFLVIWQWCPFLCSMAAGVCLFYTVHHGRDGSWFFTWCYPFSYFVKGALARGGVCIWCRLCLWWRWQPKLRCDLCLSLGQVDMGFLVCGVCHVLLLRRNV